MRTRIQRNHPVLISLEGEVTERERTEVVFPMYQIISLCSALWLVASPSCFPSTSGLTTWFAASLNECEGTGHHAPYGRVDLVRFAVVHISWSGHELQIAVDAGAIEGPGFVHAPISLDGANRAAVRPLGALRLAHCDLAARKDVDGDDGGDAAHGNGLFGSPKGFEGPYKIGLDFQCRRVALRHL